MADKTITELPALSAYGDLAVIPIDSGVQTYKLTKSVLVTGIQENLQLPVAGFHAVVGGETWCTHATIAAALADAALTTGVHVLVVSDQTLATTIAANKAWWTFTAKPGVILTAGAATVGFTVSAARIRIEGFKFAGFTTAVSFTAGGEYGRVLNCNFATCTNNVSETGVTAFPLEIGSITE